ncbi:DUF6223 family protein [Streptomyces sp. HUAS ZL42]|uniref:DUF6223 family protein n=1 Tax=Streptomyces sp. HUAS ZL42 TaxID=3231715 RepID=UPI00345E8EF6
MSVRRPLTAAPAALLGAAGSCRTSSRTGLGRRGGQRWLRPGRARGGPAAAPAGVVIDVPTLRSTGRAGGGQGQDAAFVAVGLGLVGAVFGVVAMAGSGGGVGAGERQGGFFVGVGLGLVGAVFGVVAMAGSGGGVGAGDGQGGSFAGVGLALVGMVIGRPGVGPFAPHRPTGRVPGSAGAFPRPGLSGRLPE